MTGRTLEPKRPTSPEQMYEWLFNGGPQPMTVTRYGGRTWAPPDTIVVVARVLPAKWYQPSPYWLEMVGWSGGPRSQAEADATYAEMVYRARTFGADLRRIADVCWDELEAFCERTGAPLYDDCVRHVRPGPPEQFDVTAVASSG